MNPSIEDQSVLAQKRIPKEKKEKKNIFQGTHYSSNRNNKANI